MTDRSPLAHGTKVPEVTIGFWILKILATTLGETAGDSVSMTMGLGYLVGTAIFLALLAALVAWQIAARRFHPLLYWATIVASTTAGTTLADVCTRSLGIGYPGGSLLLMGVVAASLLLWYRVMGSISIETVRTPRVELFYWLTITCSQTLGTALGDWVADGGAGYTGAAALFGAAIAVLAGLALWTRASRTFLFWAAFVLTRPLGAAVGDYLDKPLANGGLAFSRPLASVALLVTMLVVGFAVEGMRRRGVAARG